MKHGRKGPPRGAGGGSGRGGPGGRKSGRGGGRPIRGNSPPGGGPAGQSRKGGGGGPGKSWAGKGGPGGRGGQAGTPEGGRPGPGGEAASRKGPRQGGGRKTEGGPERKRWTAEGPPRGPKRWNQAPLKPGRLSGPPPSKPELGRLMALYGVRLSPHTLDLLWKYHQFLRANNKDLDLTRLIGFETMAQRHYADCMILHGLMQGRWPSPLVDVGSGAGFPGIMIKLMSPGTRIVLAEPRPRRVDFLERAIKELGLKDISVFPHKVTSRSFTEPMAGTITRAFETVEKSLPRFGGCLGVGGKAIFMKGPKVAEELTDLGNDEYRVIKNHVYRIPNTTLDRALLVMERIKVPAPGEAAPEPEADEDIPDPDDSAAGNGEAGSAGDEEEA